MVENPFAELKGKVDISSLSTRRAPQSPAPLQFWPAGRSCRGRGRTAPFWRSWRRACSPGTTCPGCSRTSGSPPAAPVLWSIVRPRARCIPGKHKGFISVRKPWPYSLTNEYYSICIRYRYEFIYSAFCLAAVLFYWHKAGHTGLGFNKCCVAGASVSDPYSLNPDPDNNLNPDPDPVSDPDPSYFLSLSEFFFLLHNYKIFFPKERRKTEFWKVTKS